MVARILQLFNKEFTNLHQAAYLLGGFAFLSQLLGLVRDRLLAHFFGAGATLDVYYAAFRIPDFLYLTFASFVSITVLIPFLAERLEYGEDGGVARARAFLDSVFSAFFPIMAAVSAIAFALAPFLADYIVPGFSGDQKDLFVQLTRILLISPIILGVSSLLGSITQTYKKFFVYAGAPVLYNAGIVFGILFLMPFFGITGVVYGVLIGSALHFLVQIPVVASHGLMPRLSIHHHVADLKKVVALSLPRTITLSASSIALMALIALASRLGEGSIAIFNFSFNLQSAPLSIIGVSYSVAAFPTLARLFAGGARERFVEHITAAARHIIFWSTPAVVLFIVLRAQIVRVVLGTGAFDWSDTRLTAAALAVFSVSLLAQSLQLLLVRGYYASGRTTAPLVINIFSAGLTIALGYGLLKLFALSEGFRFFIESLLRIEDLSGTAIVMLPLAYTIGMIINAILLWGAFGRDFKEFSLSLERAFVQSFAASIIMGFVAYRVLGILGDTFNINTFRGIFAEAFWAATIGLVAGVFVLKILGNREVEEIGGALARRFKSTSTIAPDKEEI
ncbi:MAG: murein biosynthesis integral membrane protein MurJ [Patescibacteria group bacterium]